VFVWFVLFSKKKKEERETNLMKSSFEKKSKQKKFESTKKRAALKYGAINLPCRQSTEGATVHSELKCNPQ